MAAPGRVTTLLLAEYALRELTQREEMLRRRAITLQKTIVIESDKPELDKTNKAQLEKINEQLAEAQAQYPRKAYLLYGAESMLVSGFKEPYDSLRRDATWYMHEEMVQDCSDQGGCCSRKCGCCAQRSASNMKGAGHCTTECWCCIGYRGFELPEEDKEEIRKNFESRLEDQHSVYLLKVANWFFCPLEPQPKPRPMPQPKSRWKQIFERGSASKKRS